MRSALLIVTAAGAYIISYILCIFSDSNAVRGLFGVFAVFFLFTFETISLTKKKVPAVLALCVLLILVPINLVKDVQGLNELKAENYADETYAGKINEVVADYESNSGTTVTKLRYCYDSENDLNKNSVLYVGWGVKPIINLGRMKTDRPVFECGKMSEDKKAEIFGDVNFTDFDSKTQIVFSSDTVYLCIY